VDDNDPEKPVPTAQAPIVYVAGDYFEAMGIPLIAGRLPNGREMWENSDRLLVNAIAAALSSQTAIPSAGTSWAREEMLTHMK
jgi:hypothetical protein